MNNSIVEIMRCRVGEQEFGILRTKMQSVQQANRIKVLQNSAENFEAILPTTEGDLPVLRLADFIDATSDVPIAQQRLMVLRSSWGLWCLLVDEVSQAQYVKADAIRKLPSVAKVNIATTVYSDSEKLLLMLESDHMHPNASVSAEIESPDESTLNLENIKSTKQGHLVIFNMPGPDAESERFAVGLTPKQIDQVLRNPQIKPIPTTPNYLIGVVNWHSRLVPVLDLGQRFGLHQSGEARFDKHDRVVIMHGLNADQMVGFYANPAVNILTLPAPHSELPDVGIDGNLIYGAARFNGQKVLIPHIENLALAG